MEKKRKIFCKGAKRVGIGIWKNGVLVEGVRIFPSSKYNYEIIDKNFFDSLTYSFMVTQTNWTNISSNQPSLAKKKKIIKYGFFLICY